MLADRDRRRCRADHRCLRDRRGRADRADPKTASVASVAVTGSALALGATAQFIATATLSDGSTQNVTTAATWASSNQSVASVTSAGIVNAQAPGDADIAATYSGVSGKAHVSLVRPPALVAVISGTIRDAYSGGILPNISVALVDSHSAIKSTRTDATGNYSVANVAMGPLTISFSATSYVTQTETVAVSTDTRIDVTLQRDGPISGPALLTIHAPYVYRGSALTIVVRARRALISRSVERKQWTSST